jgi:hypothetical protein
LKTGIVIGIGGAMIALLGACGTTNQPANTGSSSASPTASPTSSPTSAANATSTATASAPAFAVQATLTGADPVNGAFIVAAPGGCVAPNDLSGTINGHQVGLHIVAMVAQPGQAQALSPGDITVSFDADIWAVGSAANSPKPSSGTLHINADASGAVAFQNLYLSSTSGSMSLESGQFSWSCH